MAKRNDDLDILRGICVLSILMIHTTFWSGGRYVAWGVQSASLLVDVPAFFFIAGATIALIGRFNPASVVWKMALYFGVALFLYDIFAWFWTGKLDFSATINALKLQGFKTPIFAVLGGSYWFVPNFILVSIVGAVVLLFFRKIYVLIALLCFAPYIYTFSQGIVIPGSMLGGNINHCVAFLGLYLLGFYFFKNELYKGKKFAITFILVGAITFVILLYITGDYSKNGILYLQNQKFPQKLPYIAASLFGIGALLLVWQYFCAYKSKIARVYAGGGGVTPLDSEKFSIIGAHKIKVKFFHKIIFAIERYLAFAGKNAMLFYIAQGVSSSFLLYLIPDIVTSLMAHFVSSKFLLKTSFCLLLIIAFLFNTICCALLVLALKAIFTPLEYLLNKLR